MSIQEASSIVFNKHITLKKMMKHAIIQRTDEDTLQTTGELNCTDPSGNFFCDTLELPDLNNQHNISRIPAGTYTCKWTFSPRHKQFTYEITNVLNRSGIRFDISNWSKQLNGCVGVGNDFLDANAAGEIEIIHSHVTWDAFNAYFKKEDFMLTIIDVVPQETKLPV